MKLTIDFEKKQVIFTGDGSWIDFAECVRALESIDCGNEESWSVSFRNAEVPQVSNLLNHMSKPYVNLPKHPFKNPADFYREFSKTNDPVQHSPYVVYCGDLSPKTDVSTNTSTTTNLNYN